MDRKFFEDQKKLTELLQKAAQLETGHEQAAFLETVSKVFVPGNNTIH